MKAIALQLVVTQDTFAAISWLAAQDDPVAVAKAFAEILRDVYWQEKNLSLAIAFGRAGAQFALTAAAAIESTEPERALELRSSAKGMTYNLASFTWPGWNEPGIEITVPDVALGLDAARANLRLANELKKGDLPLSRAHWMLGAQQLAAGQYSPALESFQLAERYAEAASNPAEAKLAAGFRLATQIIAESKTGSSAADSPASRDLETLQAELRTLPDGEAFCGQIETALAVFAGSLFAGSPTRERGRSGYTLGETNNSLDPL